MHYLQGIFIVRNLNSKKGWLIVRIAAIFVIITIQKLATLGNGKLKKAKMKISKYIDKWTIFTLILASIHCLSCERHCNIAHRPKIRKFRDILTSEQIFVAYNLKLLGNTKNNTQGKKAAKSVLPFTTWKLLDWGEGIIKMKGH